MPIDPVLLKRLQEIRSQDKLSPRIRRATSLLLKTEPKYKKIPLLKKATAFISRKLFPSKPMEFKVGEGLKLKEEQKAKEVVRKPAIPLKPVEYTPEAKWRATEEALRLKREGKPIPKEIAEPARIFWEEAEQRGVIGVLGPTAPLKTVVTKVPTITKLIKRIKPVLPKIKPERIIKEAIIKPKITLKQIIKPPKIPELKALESKLRIEQKASKVGSKVGKETVLSNIKELREEKTFLESIRTGILKGMEKEKNIVRKKIGFQRHIKELSPTVQSRLKQVHGIKEWKNASKEQLDKVLHDMRQLKEGDNFLTDKQIIGLKHYIDVGKFGKDPRIITKSEMITKFKESKELLDKGLVKYISNTGFPTVEIKKGHPVIKRIVDKADIELRASNKIIKQKNEILDTLMEGAEKSRKQKIFKLETGKAIFRKLSGQEIKLTAEEQKTANYLKSYFEQARIDLGLEKYRKNYITHIEQPFMEKIFDKGIFGAIKDYMKPKTLDIPLDIMLALDNIIGSEKFFRFALQRRGGLTPSMNIRRIFKEYSTLVETKKTLDKLLPEAQASQQLLLQKKSAVWMKQFLQNLKGRALDFKFRSGDMGWVAKTADKIIDIGYIRLLALNVWSGVKNIVGGEVNSFVYQSFNKYLLGKRRFISSPKKTYKIISDMGLLEGSYVDIVKQNIVSKGKKWINRLLYATMQTGEYEMRGSYLLGQMTKAEWKAGTLSPQRFREILDGIAITQGIYTKTDSPLFVQTILGRSVMQFGRWKITNSLLARRVANGMKAEISQGIYTGKNTRRLLKMLVTTGTGMYLSYEAGKAGYKRGKQVAEASAELVLTLVDLVTGKAIYDALAKNPALQTLGTIVFSMQQLASYITGGLIEEPYQLEFRQGIEDMYVAGFKTLGIQKEGEKEKLPIRRIKSGGKTGLPIRRIK